MVCPYLIIHIASGTTLWKPNTAHLRISQQGCHHIRPQHIRQAWPSRDAAHVLRMLLARQRGEQCRAERRAGVLLRYGAAKGGGGRAAGDATAGCGSG